MAKKRKEYDDDDGRVVAPMNVDGMPWYVREKSLPQSESKEKIELSKEESRAFAGGIFKAVALVAGVFILAYTLFILFCVFVYAR